MVEEEDVIEFLESQGGKASIEDVSNGLGIPKYGSNSAFMLLQKLKEKGVVEKKGKEWLLKRKEKKEVEEEKKEERKPEVKPTPPVDMQALMEMMAKTFSTVVKTSTPPDEWELATKPMETKVEEKAKELDRFIIKPDRALEAKKPLIGFKTGTFLDNMFFSSEGKPLNGIPICGQFAITGLPGAGKSILVEEIAIRVAANDSKVLYVTAEDTWKSETPRFDLQSRLKQKADLLGLNWEKIVENLFVMDTVSTPELREWTNFAETYRYVAEKENIELAIIDSVTVLESYRGALKYRVMELARYNQIKGITGLFVNQRSTETWDTYDMAGGIGLAHNLDGTIIIDYGRVYWFDQQTELGMRRGEFVRIARILDCRLCDFERRRIKIDITREGFVRPIGALPEKTSRESGFSTGEEIEE